MSITLPSPICPNPSVIVFFFQLSLPLSDYSPSPVLDGWQLTHFHLSKQLWVIFCLYSPECGSGLCLTCYACSYFTMGYVQFSYCILVFCCLLVGSLCGNGHFIPGVFAQSNGSHCAHFHHNMLDEGFLFYVLNILLIDWRWVWLISDKCLWICISSCLEWVQISFRGLKLTRSPCTPAKEEKTFQFGKKK